MRLSLRAATIGAIMLQFAACASLTGPAPVAPPPEPAIVQLRAREQNLTSLQSLAVMEYVGPHGRVKARERITVRRPAELRVEALSPLGVALIVTADANQIAVFDPSKNTIARGPATAATLERVAQIPLEPAQAVRLLLALPPVSVDAGLSAEGGGADAMQLFSFVRGGLGRGELGFSNGNLAMVRVTQADQSTEYEVHYSDYHDIGAMNFPDTIEAVFPHAAISIKVRYEMPSIDTTLPDSTFALPSGPGIRELSLSANSAGASAQG